MACIDVLEDDGPLSSSFKFEKWLAPLLMFMVPIRMNQVHVGNDPLKNLRHSPRQSFVAPEVMTTIH